MPYGLCRIPSVLRPCKGLRRHGLAPCPYFVPTMDALEPPPIVRLGTPRLPGPGAGTYRHSHRVDEAVYSLANVSDPAERHLASCLPLDLNGLGLPLAGDTACLLSR